MTKVLAVKQRTLTIISFAVSAAVVGYSLWLHKREHDTQVTVGFLFVAAGALMICGAGGDWDWFMNRVNPFLTRLCSRTGARIVYVFIGLLVVLWGLWFQLGP